MTTRKFRLNPSRKGVDHYTLLITVVFLHPDPPCSCFCPKKRVISVEDQHWEIDCGGFGLLGKPTLMNIE